jgi:hypothetical protein
VDPVGEDVVAADDRVGTGAAPGMAMIVTRDAVRAGRIAMAVGRAGLLPTVAIDDGAMLEVLQHEGMALLIVDATALGVGPGWA